jgi:predicted  nucleic acid-binding Zn-ribbon protein
MYECKNCGEHFDRPEHNQYNIIGCPICGNNDYVKINKEEDEN